MASTHKVSVFHIARIVDDVPGAGGGAEEDYAQILGMKQAELGNASVNSHFLSNAGALHPDMNWANHIAGCSLEDRAAFEQQLVAFIQQYAREEGYRLPVLAVHTSERVGRAVSPSIMTEIPTIIISHEFATCTEETQIEIAAKFVAAKAVFFTTEGELQAAYQKIAALYDGEEAEKLRQKSAIYPVPSNILPTAEQLVEPEQRENNLVVFGLIYQEGKNYRNLPALAKAMKEDAYFTGRYIDIVGAVPEEKENRHPTLRQLLEQTYDFVPKALDGLNAEETIFLTTLLESGAAAVTARNRMPVKIAELLESTGVPEKKLPIRFHLNLPPSEVAAILGRNRYFFSSRERGATGHSGSLSAAYDARMLPIALKGETPVSGSDNSVVLLEDNQELLDFVKRHEAQGLEHERAIIERAPRNNWEAIATAVNQRALTIAQNHYPFCAQKTAELASSTHAL